MCEDSADVVGAGSKRVVLVILQQSACESYDGVQRDDEEGSRERAALQHSPEDEHDQLFAVISKVRCRARVDCFHDGADARWHADEEEHELGPHLC